MYWTSESRIHSRKRDGKIIVAMQDGKLVGCLIANGSEIEILCVKKRYRKRGIGKILIQHVENEWKNDKRRKSIIACSLKNFKAKKFYEKMGFEVENKKEWLKDYSWHFRKALR
jgi:ribosomal protein S18 acetylase RimI-like enzyme